MSTYLPALRAELSFGDMCDAEFLFDVHVRRDARAMGSDLAGAGYAKKRWNTDDEVRFFLPGINIQDDESYVLAHGVHRQAALLSDDCLIATALGRDTGTPTRRRLLFAPVVEGTGDEVAELDGSNFARFPLPADEHHGTHAIVELRRCFMVDARDIHAALQAGALRTRSLSDGSREQLAIRWAAYTLRRGPFVAEDNAEKFAELLLDNGRADEETALDVATKVANVVAAAWGAEGRGVEGLGIAADEKLPVDDAIEELATQLVTLRDASDAAIAALRAL
ncbi:MAG: hypothetical protein M3417_08805 [Actinomycetota bacterium]|nr:hypothetical protein [Actinomycetota bacterium]